MNTRLQSLEEQVRAALGEHAKSISSSLGELTVIEETLELEDAGQPEDRGPRPAPTASTGKAPATGAADAPAGSEEEGGEVQEDWLSSLVEE